MPWTQKQLTVENKLFLKSLPLTRTVDDAFVAVHSSLDPDSDADFYIRSEEDSLPTLGYLVSHASPYKICFFGHTHHPVVYEYDNGKIDKKVETQIPLSPSCHYLINPGSVGQSRDADARASFLIYDTNPSSVSFFRVPYDREACLRKARKARILYTEGALSKEWTKMKIRAKGRWPALYGWVRNRVRRYFPYRG